jgi:hypothetical protein
MIALIVAGVALLATFLLAERRATEPIVPLEIFRNRVYSVAGAVGFIVGLAPLGAVTYLPLYLQDVKGHSPTISGLLITPMMAGLLISSMPVFSAPPEGRRWPSSSRGSCVSCH